ncbi:MFS transporter [Nocardia aobensis]|uniref:MFS transporter n=1 Tax=Nocardia aobensis TaxID=257277 RepID=A0ABW6PF52_9NOCA
MFLRFTGNLHRPATRSRGHVNHWSWRVCAATLVLQAVFYGVRILVSYRLLALSGSATTVGVATAVYSLAPLFIAMRVGRAVDRGHIREMFTVGIALTVTGCLTLAFSETLWIVGVGSVMVGTGQLLVTVAGQGFISVFAAATQESLDRGFARLTLSVSIGQALGIPFVGAIVTHHPHTGVETTRALLVLAALGAASLAFVVKLPGPDKRSANAIVSHRQSVRQMLRLPGLAAAILSSLVVLTAMDLVVAYMPVLGQELGFSVTMVSLLITVRTGASILSRALLPLVLRFVSRRKLLISATLLPALPTAAIPLVDGPWAIAALMGTAGLFWGIGQPLTMTWVVSLVSPENKGAALSLRLTGNRLGQVGIPIGAGLAAGLGGTTGVFVIIGCLLAAAAAATTKSSTAG